MISARLSALARIDHSFSIDKPPELAQAMFVRDIAPELAQDRDFQITRERPGQLVFSDGEPSGSEVVDPGLGGSTQEREDSEASDAPLGGGARNLFMQNVNARSAPDDLPGLFARHVHVDFTPEGAGTRVRLHGHLERDVCHGLKLLGTPQHWPEIADQPHD
jgi:hypothetical protein